MLRKQIESVPISYIKPISKQRSVIESTQRYIAVSTSTRFSFAAAFGSSSLELSHCLRITSGR